LVRIVSGPERAWSGTLEFAAILPDRSDRDGEAPDLGFRLLQWEIADPRNVPFPGIRERPRMPEEVSGFTTYVSGDVSLMSRDMGHRVSELG
jgi:hypothetical protein